MKNTQVEKRIAGCLKKLPATKIGIFVISNFIVTYFPLGLYEPGLIRIVTCMVDNQE